MVEDSGSGGSVEVERLIDVNIGFGGEDVGGGGAVSERPSADWLHKRHFRPTLCQPLSRGGRALRRPITSEQQLSSRAACFSVTSTLKSKQEAGCQRLSFFFPTAVCV